LKYPNFLFIFNKHTSLTGEENVGAGEGTLWQMGELVTGMC